MSSVLETIRSDVKNWWWYLIIGIIFIIGGITIFARPLDGYVGLSVLFSVVILSSGFGQIFFSLSNSSILKGWGWILVSGILDVAIGTYLLMYPVVTMATLPYFVGFWLVFRSFYLMGASFDLKDLNAGGWGWLLFGGIVVLVLGFLVIYYPAAGAVGIVAVSGSAFIVGGFLNIYLGFQLKNLKMDVSQIQSAIGKYKHA
ncbi:HdeD family acid-resistance protein [Puia dinghuensis]|uniref:Membrane protein n=1 Tax=Puia dinghuensis TaxID=1792502 RepID=A0A8J2UDF1_9BACT|nr:DUF308 domain-containing protein [Puia dinghuensis]GGB01984.1 membrane protein [Puia dinghuensis]